MTGKKRQDDDLLLALARGRSRTEAARETGISPRTVDRRLADADFRRRLNAMRTELVEQATGCLANAATLAAETLVRLLDCPAPAVALGAARAILDGVMRLREHGELAARIEELEERIENDEVTNQETGEGDPEATQYRTIG